MDQLRTCDAFLWHLNQDEPADLHFARSVLYAAETMGLRVFPNRQTCWHFDDKIAQKYLLEAVGAPLAPSWAFYSRTAAMAFLESAKFPLVFKLRRGAGSVNVRLVRSRDEGATLTRRMFGGGLRQFPAVERVRRAVARASAPSFDKAHLYQRAVRTLRRLLRQIARPGRERGYVLFQEFIPENDCDIRAAVIGDRCFVFRRGVRPNDFRASGSGRLIYLTASEMPLDVVETAFSISKRLGFQSMGYDFVRDPLTKRPVLLEMSYVFVAQAVAACPGYLTGVGEWREGPAWPQDLTLEDLLR